jgi:AmiR/NasT family two-component response regulator
MSAERRLRVVIAEDDFLVGTEVVRLAESLGCEVLGVARDAPHAVEMVRALRPDLAILDIQMRGTSGLDAAAQIRDASPVPVVVLTAFESPELVAQASAAGVGAYLTKPPERAELQRAITIAVARHADMVALREANLRLQKALDEVKTLTGLLPMCCFCKRVRTDEGYWQAVDHYISAHTTARVSHGFCPDCAAEHYPEELGGMGGGEPEK